MRSAHPRTLSAFMTEAQQKGLSFTDAHLDVHTQAGDLLKPRRNTVTGETVWHLNIASPGPDKGGQLIVVDSLAREKSRRNITAFVVTINENKREQRLLVEIYGKNYYNIKLPQHRTRPCPFPYLPKELSYTSGQQAWWGIELFRAITLLTAGRPERLKISSHYADALTVVATAEALCLAIHGAGFCHAHFPHSTGYCKLRDETETVQRTLQRELQHRLGQAPIDSTTDFARYLRNTSSAPESGACRDLIRAVYTPVIHHRQQCRTARKLALSKARWARTTAAQICTKAGYALHDPVVADITALLRTTEDELSLASQLAMGPRLFREACGDGADLIIAQSDTMREQRAALPHLKLCSIPNAINTTLFHPLRISQTAARRELERLTGLPNGWLDARPLIVGGGRFESRKGLVELSAATAEMCSFFPAARLVLFGNHSHPQDCSETESQIVQTIEALVSQHPVLDGHVALLGKQSQQVLAQLFYAADLCIFPNREEPDGLVVKEALATANGQQVVITTTTTNAALQMNALAGETVCHLVPPDDITALAEKMVACMRDFQRCAKACQVGGRFIHRHLGQAAYTERVLAAIHSAASAPSPPRKIRSVHRLAAAAGLTHLLTHSPVRISKMVASACHHDPSRTFQNLPGQAQSI
jgi:glycosyltransferase involved in cell wall biosynthesis